MTVTVKQLQAFADAWNRHDIETLMSFMTDDCVFQMWTGPLECGTRYSGTAEVRRGFVKAWLDFPDAHWGGAQHFISGERGLSEWIFTGRRATDGARIEVRGCDVFTFRSGRIAVKNSFRKLRTTA